MASQTATGSAPVQGRLWSARADDWAEIQERQVAPAYAAAFDALASGRHPAADAGCGAGGVRLAAAGGGDVAGLDASEVARPCAATGSAPARMGDLESLPFDDASFDVVTGFNSFQYAARPARARRGGTGDPLSRARGCRHGARPRPARPRVPGAGRLDAAPHPAEGPFALGKGCARAALPQRRSRRRRFGDGRRCGATPTSRRPSRACSRPGRSWSRSSIGEPAVRRAVVASMYRTAAGGYEMTNVFRYVIGTPEEETR